MKRKKVPITKMAEGEEYVWEAAHAWAEEAFKNKWVDTNFDNGGWYDEGELASSIVGWWREKKAVARD